MEGFYIHVAGDRIAVKCDQEWQKGYILAKFDRCDNAFRVDDENFMYAHFRYFGGNFCFYTDAKGIDKKPKRTVGFYELFPELR